MDDTLNIPGTPLTGSAESAIAAPKPVKEVKPRRTAKRHTSADDEAAEASPVAEKMYWITLHDSKEIPPNGQFVGVNGRGYLIRPGIRTHVPKSVLEVLDNAVQAVPDINEKLQIVGMRNAPRLSYTLHVD